MTRETLQNGEKVTAFITLKNTGGYDAKETVQLYMRTPVASMMRPIRELKAFRKVSLSSGETVRVSFQLGQDDMGYYDRKGNYIVEKGKREIFIGGDCFARNKTEITIM